MRSKREKEHPLLLSLQICSVLLLMLFAVVGVSGQTIFGRISGTVKDANGGVVPNATVTVTNTATNLQRSATTDESGFYTVTNLPAGNYNVSAEQKGFKKAVEADYRLAADSRLTVDFALEAGEVSETA